MKESSKYYPLYQFFKQSNEDIILLTVADVQSILDGNLPVSARTQRAWWSNRRTANAQSSAWLDAGYRVDQLNLENNQIIFRKEGTIPPQEIRRDRGIVLWNSAMIKALREHMHMNQAEFAQELGVRQPTISEWETGTYEPKRSSSKLLTLIAERADFKYEIS
jgi:DNA-binding transcriptional regulator YiaG